MTPAELVELCKTRITDHVDSGGEVLFEDYGYFSAAYATGLNHNCGCALSIACAPMIQPTDFSFFNGNEETRSPTSTLISHYLGLSDCNRTAFVQGIDERSLIEDYGFAPEEESFYRAGIEVRNWIRKNGFAKG